MNKTFAFSLAIVWGLVVGMAHRAVAQAPGTAPCASCAKPDGCPYTEAKATVNRLTERRVPTCESETRKLWKPEIKEVQGSKWVDVDVCREIEEEVPCTKLVPVTVTDPATGCTRTEYQPQTYVEKVRHLVIQIIPVKKEYHYRVLTFRSEEIDVPKTEPVFECAPPETVTTKVPSPEPAPCGPTQAPGEHK